MKTLVVTDIHGQYAELQRALEHAKFADSDRIINLGDMIDRGPDSRQVVEFFVGRRKDRRFDVHVRGNHEALVLSILEGNIDARREWIEIFYGSETLQSYGKYRGSSIYDTFPSEHLRFFREMALEYNHGSWLFRHAPDNYQGDKILVCGHHHEQVRPRVEKGRIHLAVEGAVYALDLDELIAWGSDGDVHAVDEGALCGAEKD